MLKKNDKKTTSKYVCKKCDFYTNKKTDYTRHIHTKKHNAIHANENVNEKNSYKCVCGKTYKQQPSLSRHKKTCTYNPEEENIKLETNEMPTRNTSELSALLMELIETNKDLKNEIIELASKPRTVNNTQNNSFNLNNFLNIQCRDAMNLSQFIDEIQVTFQDLLYLGNNGFVESFKDLFVKKLKDMHQTKRPIHCTDQKRKACVVKEHDKWHKDDSDEILFDAVDKVNRKQINAFSQHAKNRDKDYLADDTNLENNSKIIIEMCGYNKKNAEAIHKKIKKHITDNASIKKQLLE
jgi:ferritin